MTRWIDSDAMFEPFGHALDLDCVYLKLLVQELVEVHTLGLLVAVHASRQLHVLLSEVKLPSLNPLNEIHQLPQNRLLYQWLLEVVAFLHCLYLPQKLLVLCPQFWLMMPSCTCFNLPSFNRAIINRQHPSVGGLLAWFHLQTVFVDTTLRNAIFLQ